MWTQIAYYANYFVTEYHSMLQVLLIVILCIIGIRFMHTVIQNMFAERESSWQVNHWWEKGKEKEHQKVERTITEVKTTETAKSG